jgi:hypothetical protein
MKLWQKIIEAYPEIKPDDFFPDLGIYLSDDGDGIDYIVKWEYSKPIPEGLTLGKPSA